ncbi:GIY-YIG nuclease family protein [Cohnella yongneupensis]|uniref:GIY-YIG nuclease family protein n=1 Tax=Cohnella yongneupensis TaxID=425006 RepID=A0ABW0QW70_9BACL
MKNYDRTEKKENERLYELGVMWNEDRPQWKLQVEQTADALIQQTPVEIKPLTRFDFPKKGGVYAFTTVEDDKCIYVGKSGDLRDRVFNAHLTGKGRSSRRGALLGRKKTRDQTPVTTEDDLDDYIEQHYRLRFYIIEDITLRGCIEDYLNALLKPIYSVSLSKK